MTLQCASAVEAILDEFRRVFTPREPLGTAEWAQRYRRLSSKASAEEGPWRNERVPYLKGIMDALDESHPAPLVVFKKSSQVGGSECAVNWVCRNIQEAPSGMLALFPSEKDSKKWVRSRLEPAIAQAPTLRDLIPVGRRSDAGNTLQEKHFKGGVLHTGSANVPTDVAAVSVARVLLDEVDRMPPVLEDEGDPVELAKRRASTFPQRKVFEISSPTTEESSRIHADYLASTQDRFYVPCPHCQHMQPLVWENLKWPEGKHHEAAYACEECGALISEHEKTEMLAAGEWRPSYPEREAVCKGFHINALYSPLGLGETWAEHAAAWDAAKGKPAKLQVFYNTRLGEVVKSERVRVEWQAVHARREAYRLRTIPAGVLLLSTGVDVQKDRLEVQMLGWGREERITVVDYHVIPGDPTRTEVWTELEAYHAKEILNSFGVRMRSSACMIDAGNWQHEVINFTRERRRSRLYASKGAKSATRPPISRPSHIDVNWRGETLKRGAELYVLGVSEIKRIVFERLRSDESALPADRVIRFSDELPEEYFRQLTAEVHEAKVGWRKVYDRNEALDTMVYAFAAAMHHTCAVNRMRELDWQRLEETLQPVGGPPGNGDAPKGIGPPYTLENLMLQRALVR